MPFIAATRLVEVVRRSVAKTPGRMLLMVTLAWATSRATPARKAVRPARAAEETSSPVSGVSTLAEVMLTMRPKPRAIMPSTTACVSSSGVAMFCATPSSSASRVTSRKGLGGGPPLLLTRMSTSGDAASSACWPALVETSATTAITVAPVLARIALAVSSRVLASRPLMTTVQPASASAWAQPRPSPLLEAQTMAVRPAIPRSMVFLRISSVRAKARFSGRVIKA